MTAADALAAELVASDRFAREYGNAAAARVARDLLGDEPGSAPPAVDWSYLMSCASVLALAEAERPLDAALRIMQTALVAAGARPEHRDAAAMLLDRIGNRPALDLAQARGIVGDRDLAQYPAPLRMDIVRSRLSLVVPSRDGASLPVSRFQRDLWTAVDSADWVSASAPTSAGKSMIVRRWFRELVDRAVAAPQPRPRRFVAVVPTRALVDEVGRALARELPRGVPVRTVPWDANAATAPIEVYVLTQERLHLLQQRFPALTTDLVFVDEAHKFGDGARGVLLHQVLDEAVRRNPKGQVVFASPLADDPQVLLDTAPSAATTAVVDSQAVTVTQNLLYANAVPGSPRTWTLELVLPSGPRALGRFELGSRPQPDGKRLPLVAVALGRRTGGNLVYADGAAIAERTARLIHDAVGPAADVSSDPDVAALIDLVRRTVSPRYGLATVLERGVAFHYGNMPQLVRAEIEELFRREKLRFLVCTSTLLEGVNLPCRSLFVRGPHRGRSTPMSPADFWNLAGRAGRWGMEFEGNVVCVDTADASRWPDVPRRRVRQRIRRETATVLADPAALLAYVAAGTPPAPPRRELEAVYSFLAARIANGVPLEDIPGLALAETARPAVAAAIADSLHGVQIPAPLLAKHAGLSPLSIQRLLDRMRSARPESLLLALPEEQRAWESYARAFGLLAETMGAGFGVAGRQRMLGVLVVMWMQGRPLIQLVDNRLGYQASLPRPASPATTIRGVMEDVETVARFLAPKYLSCYVDVLRQHVTEIGRLDLLAAMPDDIYMLLELGVSTATEVSLLSLGLSRTSAVELFAHIADDTLTPVQCTQWLADHALDTLDLPELVRREIAQATESAAPPTQTPDEPQ
ncbi:MAG: DEAD/DEAH box helicase [Actinobacteria bacterium]|nr:DEAD/DEAH box helicase [Actinomycetota bacterium]MCA1721166.1 DEAD/DEAH box helicase [Actinomycetota bacterium]